MATEAEKKLAEKLADAIGQIHDLKAAEAANRHIPPAPLGARGGFPNEDPNTMTMEEYRAWRKRQVGR